MKKSIVAIVLLLIAVIGVFVFSYHYRNQKVSQQTSDIHTTAAPTTSEEPKSEESQPSDEGNRLLFEDKTNDYQVYYDGSVVNIVHKDYSRQFTSWTYSVNCETPTMFCKDYDGDGEVELLLKIVNGKKDVVYSDDESIYTYSVYMFKPVVTSSGEKTFSSLIASADTWKAPFESAIKCEMTQLEGCKKILQFAMNDSDKEISYNKETGITTNKYVGYAAALANTNGKFYKLSRWSKGAGIYNIDDKGNLTLDIQVLVNYEETTQTHYIGNIHCEMDIINNKFNIAPKTIVFNPLEQCQVNDPRDTAKNNWECVISNASTNTNFKSTNIDWIESELSLKNTSDKSTQYFESIQSKIKCVDTVKFTQDKVVLTAKEGYTFSEPIAESGKFSVIINNGEDNASNIAYTCTVENKNKTSTLTITFDKTYDKEDFDKVLINFGV